MIAPQGLSGGGWYKRVRTPRLASVVVIKKLGKRRYYEHRAEEREVRD